MKLLFKLLLFSLLVLPVHHVLAADLADSFSISLGMVNVSFTESPSALESEEGEEAEEAGSGSSAVISLDMTYNRPLDDKKEIYARGIVPFMPSTGAGLILGGGGMNYYFNGLSADVKRDDESVRLRISPSMRYYVGAELGFGYLIYTTESAKKSDLLLNIGGHGGMTYAFRDNWSFKGELGIGKGMGTKVSTTMMRVMLGLSYTF